MSETNEIHAKYERVGVPVARRKPQTLAGHKRVVSGNRLGDDRIVSMVRHLREEAKVEEEKRQERRRRALELRKQGHTYDTISRQTGVPASTVHLDVKRALANVTVPSAAELLKLELERLEGLYLISYTALAKSVAATQGEDPHLGALDRCLAITRTKSRLLGITDAQGNSTNVNVVMGDQHNTTTQQNTIIAEGSRDVYLAALKKIREEHGTAVGEIGTVPDDAEIIEVIPEVQDREEHHAPGE